MSRVDTASEPSMEEILAQIRKIIADEPLTSRADASRSTDRRQIDRRLPLQPAPARDIAASGSAPLPRTTSYPSLRPSTEHAASGATAPTTESSIPTQTIAHSINLATNFSPAQVVVQNGASAAMGADDDDDLSDLVEPSASAESAQQDGTANSEVSTLASKLSGLSAESVVDAPAVPSLASLLPRAPVTSPASLQEGAATENFAPAPTEEAPTAPVTLAQRLAAAVQAENLIQPTEVEPKPTSAPVEAAIDEMVKDDGAVAMLADESPTGEEMPIPQPELPAKVEPTAFAVEDPMETALGALAAGLAASRLAAPARTAAPEAAMSNTSSKLVEESNIAIALPLAQESAVAASPVVAQSPIDEASDDTMAELLRPMLKQWLDTNMPRIVERALRVELAKSLKPPK